MKTEKYLLGKYQIIEQNKSTFTCVRNNNHGEVEYLIYRISRDEINDISAITIKEFENLNHQNILNFQVEQDSEFYYLIRESKEGYDTINHELLIDSKSLNGFFTCFIQICDALIYLHSKNIAHGCLSYSTIITNKDEDYSSYLLDIGYTYINILKNINHFFAAPEQKNKSVQYSKAADIYSLAQIMLNAYYNTVDESKIYNEQQIIEDMSEYGYENELLNLFCNMIKNNPENRPNIINVKEKLEYIFRLYKNENNSYQTIIPIKFTKSAEERFEEIFDIYNYGDKIDKIEELSQGRILFKETIDNYIIILSDYVFLCSKNKGLENGYFLVVGFNEVTDRDYNGAVEVSDTLFEYYNRNNDYYDNPEEFIRNCIHKKTENYKETKDVKQEEILLKSIYNVINNKKVYYAVNVVNINKADKLIKFKVIDDEKFIIKNKKAAANILKKYFDEDIKYDDLASFITNHINELALYVDVDEKDNIITKCKKICNLFEGAVVYKDNIYMVLKQGDDIIISDDKGNEYGANVKSYNNNNTELEVELNDELYKNFVKGDEYKLCYDYTVREMIYNKQQQAFDDIKNGVSHIDGLLKKIINPKKEIVNYTDLEGINNFFNENLDDNQKEAVKKALNLQKDAEILLIQGPPGTGKTTVITEIVKQCLKKDRKAKILVASQSNQAVDNVLEKVCDEHKVLRIGRDIKKMSATAEKYSEKEVLNTIIQRNMKTLNDCKPLNNYQESYYTILSNINNAGKVDKNLKSDKVVDYFIAPIQVIFATLIGVSSWRNFRGIVFDMVIIDEAGRALLSELSVPIRKAKHIILVGDQKQLAPVMDDEVIEDVDKNADKENYKDDLLNYSFFGDFYNRLANNPNAYHFLEYNYRAHSVICRLYSDAFYGGALKSNEEYDYLKNHGLSIYKSPVVLIDTSKNEKRFDRQAGTGKINIFNAEIIKEELNNIIKDISKNNLQNKTIGIITPYAAQKDYLTKHLKDIVAVAKEQSVRIDIGTVDSFQGSDRDYIIYDSVRSEKNNRGNIKFISDEKRLNVSLSRAKELLIIIADSKFLSAAGKRKSKWPELLEIIKNNPDIYATIKK